MLLLSNSSVVSLVRPARAEVINWLREGVEELDLLGGKRA